MKGFAAVLISIMGILPSCSRIYYWGKDHFYQGEILNTTAISYAHCYAKSINAYDELTTRGIFDALWISQEVRLLYGYIYMKRRGYCSTEMKKIIQREYNDNKNFISWYMLTLTDLPFDDAQSPWSIFLKVDGQIRHPIDVRSVELPYEYRLFFGNQYDRFKRSYLVRFNAFTNEGIPIVDSQTQELILILRTFDREVCLAWPVNALDYCQDATIAGFAQQLDEWKVQIRSML